MITIAETKNSTYSVKSTKWMLTITLILSSITYYPAKVIAQTQQPATTKQAVQLNRSGTSSQQRTSRPVFVLPKTPARLSPVSGRRAGMGSRDNCPAVPTALTALVPLQREQKASKQTDKSILGIVEGVTTSERPTFWFYVPYTQDLTVGAEFILQDNAGNEIYKNAIALPPKPSVIPVSLPSNASLEVGKIYRWYLKVRCNQQQTASVPIYVEGDIQRVNLDSRVVQQLEAATDPGQKATIYAANGIWFDSLTILAQERQKNPNDASVAEDWQSLLRSVNLDNVATAPLVK
ncbi:DUF928 domain-containing protein [Brasilonema octagenarum]|uniref:DUF928 domain-containing protein n=1 Tax=Brasilonema octagenarum UFV-OR1 TaxID=417115 RepID=A0ABX1MC57_9CYAN|nr:DUF928 domain-containing protein [Brasilonema octagenarum]NMF66123.1 hypothetical protein [Brasilonema octagenarum UFV-OR1]